MENKNDYTSKLQAISEEIERTSNLLRKTVSEGGNPQLMINKITCAVIKIDHLNKSSKGEKNPVLAIEYFLSLSPFSELRSALRFLGSDDKITTVFVDNSILKKLNDMLPGSNSEETGILACHDGLRLDKKHFSILPFSDKQRYCESKK